jgi:hypothetical protein
MFNARVLFVAEFNTDTQNVCCSALEASDRQVSIRRSCNGAAPCFTVRDTWPLLADMFRRTSETLARRGRPIGDESCDHDGRARRIVRAKAHGVGAGSRKRRGRQSMRPCRPDPSLPLGNRIGYNLGMGNKPRRSWLDGPPGGFWGAVPFFIVCAIGLAVSIALQIIASWR